MPPPKKGSSAGIWGLIMFPFNTAMSVIFYPAHLLMWLIVDWIGAEVLREEFDGEKVNENREFKFTRLMGRDAKDKTGGYNWVKDGVKYVKEFRYVLYDYYKWKKVPSPAWRCKACSKTAAFYCVVCDKKFCPQCAYNIHAPGSYAELHSVEEIQKRFRTHCHFITPILPQIMFVGLLYYCFSGATFITKEYTTTQITCPAITKGRNIIGGIDANFLYHYKQSLLSWCDMEDSFVRFILDAWVRTVVTETDNTLLVYQTLPQAMLFNIVLEFALVPVIAVVFAFVLNVFYQIECRLTESGESPMLRKLESWARFLDISWVVFGEKAWDLGVPETKYRQRPDLDWMDKFKYLYGRKMRSLKFYYRYCVVGLSCFAWEVLKYTMMFRLACIWFNLSSTVRFFCKLVPYNAVATHTKWFPNAHNLIVTESLLWTVIRKGISAAIDALSTFPLLRYGLVGGLIYLILFIIALCWWSDKIVSQRRKFYGAWYKKDLVVGNGRNVADNAHDYKQPLVLVKRPVEQPEEKEKWK